ncbi:MAG: HTH domain-containing protein, partial [Prevotellaceae bacterium]|nr:HTH domain-containing protein [Prevotellaceae bacterium]
MHISFKPTEEQNVNGGVKDGANGEKLGVKLGVNDKRLGVNTEKFLVNDKKFPVNGLKILKLIEQTPQITIIELSKQLNISDRAVKNNINKLKSLGILSREGADKNGYWEIK